MVEIVKGKEIAEEIKRGIRERLKGYIERGNRRPLLVNIWFEGSKESETFLKLKEKACADVGAESRSILFSADVDKDEIIRRIMDLNADEEVDGISIQAPLPERIPMNIFSNISPDKDVEGLNPINIGRLIQGDEEIIPCTPQAVLTILEKKGIDLKGKEVVIINHSIFVGKPLSVLLLNRDATVSICHVFTKDIKKFTRSADIIITATGRPGLIGKNHIKEGAIVIDVGISRGESEIMGDVRFDEVKGKVSLITPVPGGVGPVTIACTLKNLLKLYERRMK